MLEIRNLRKSYGRNLAVDEVSFFVPDGQNRNPVGTERSREVDDHQEYCRTAPLSGADRNPGDSGKTVGGKADFRICAGDSGNV